MQYANTIAQLYAAVQPKAFYVLVYTDTVENLTTYILKLMHNYKLVEVNFMSPHQSIQHCSIRYFYWHVIEFM